MNIFDEVNSLCDQWERNTGPLPDDARHLITKLARSIVIEAGRICEARGSVETRSIPIRNEAKKCAGQLRHGLLCHHGFEECCILCDGAGCRRCEQTGLKKITPDRGLNPVLEAEIAAALECSDAADPYRNEPLIDDGYGGE